MRAFTDIFIKRPVLAVVINLMIALVGWQALTTLPIQQYPQIESSSIIITTVYYGASAETVRRPEPDCPPGSRFESYLCPAFAFNPRRRSSITSV